jgi:hypothetical protein
MDWLSKNAYDPPSSGFPEYRAHLRGLIEWNRDQFVQKKVDVEYKSLLDPSSEGLSTAIKQLRTVGLVFIHNVPNGDLEKCALRLGEIRFEFVY